MISKSWLLLTILWALSCSLSVKANDSTAVAGLVAVAPEPAANLLEESAVSALNEVIGQVANEINATFPAQKGMVVYAKGSEVYIDMGGRDSLARGMLFEVVREGDMLRSARIGESLGRLERRIGTVKVEQIRRKHSVCSTVVAQEQFRIGDLVHHAVDGVSVAVLSFVPTGRADKELALLIEQLFREQLGSAGNLRVVSIPNQDELLSDVGVTHFNGFVDPEISRDISVQLAAEVLVYANVINVDENIYINLRLCNGKTGNVFKVINKTLRKDNPLRAMMVGMKRVDVTEEQSKYGGILQGVLPYNPTSLAPYAISTRLDRELVNLIFDGLVRVEGDGSLQPCLAERWDESENGMVWIFYLRQNLAFSDHTPITAGSVKFSWEQALSSSNDLVVRRLLGGIKGVGSFVLGAAPDVDGIEVLDDYVLQVSLSRPVPGFLYNLSSPYTFVVPPQLVESDPAAFATNPVGSGAFVLKSFLPDLSLQLTANKSYFYQPVFLDGIEFTVLKDTAAAFLKFQLGEFDYYRPTSSGGQLRKLVDNSAVELQEVFAVSSYYVGINCNISPLNEIPVRRALNYAIDKKSIVEVILEGGGVLFPGFLPRTQAGNEEELAGYSFEMLAAQDILQRNGSWLPLLTEREHKFFIPADSGVFQRIAERVQVNLSDLGLKVQIVPRPFSSLVQDIIAEQPSFYLLSMGISDGDLLEALTFYFHSDAVKTGLNIGGFSDSDVDSRIYHGLKISDPVLRREAVAELDDLLIAKAPWIFLYTEKGYLATSRQTEGVVQSSFGLDLKGSWLHR